MRSFPRSLRTAGLQCNLICVAAGISLAFALLPAGVRAQQSVDPAQFPAPAADPVFHDPIPADRLAFLKGYDGKTTRDLVRDKRFRALQKLITPRTGYHYHRDMALSEAIDSVLEDGPLPIDMIEDRWVMAGTRGGYEGGRGFVWFDTLKGIAIGGVYFHPTNGEPTPTLAVFSRQLHSTALAISQLPPEFARDVAQWSLIAHVPAVTVRYFIPENGKKYVLMHDEDYCQHPELAPPLQPGQCEDLNAEAADKDYYAASFMAEMHNAANAIARMALPMSPVAYYRLASLRERSCRAAGNPRQCQIQWTRRQTQAVLSGKQ